MPGDSSCSVDPGHRCHHGCGSSHGSLWVPEHLRSDNGPEFIATCMQDWLKAQEIKTLYIKPGSPWENGHIESFHDKLRDECLNRELFSNLHEARIILES
jgi:putative transposase